MTRIYPNPKKTSEDKLSSSIISACSIVVDTPGKNKTLEIFKERDTIDAVWELNGRIADNDKQIFSSVIEKFRELLSQSTAYKDALPIEGRISDGLLTERIKSYIDGEAKIIEQGGSIYTFIGAFEEITRGTTKAFSRHLQSFTTELLFKFLELEVATPLKQLIEQDQEENCKMKEMEINLANSSPYNNIVNAFNNSNGLTI